MGSDSHHTWERPRHRVFTDAFAISAIAVTRREYERFLSATGRVPPRGWTDSNFADPDQPVVGVSWFDAQAYCDWLSAAIGRPHRLPTEAEWERACRGGRDDTEFAWGNEDPEGIEYFRSEWTAPRPVSDGRPNGFGLYHMGDNVHEWCLDWYDPQYYSTSPETNPQGPLSGSRRVSRGGSWRHRVKASRNAHRSSLPPEFQYTDYGFRLVSTE
jgi:formylglycine-generating enzyme required for sulfatase activity